MDETKSEDVTKHKMRQWTTPQWGLFITTQFDKDDVTLKLYQIDGWLDWKLNLFGWNVGVWIERTDK
jgi:hypothetical protein